MAGFLENIRNGQSINALVKSFNRISKFGMEYTDMVINNSQAMGRTESGFFNAEGTGFAESSAFRWTAALQDTKVRKYIAYFDKDYKGKRDFLRKFSLNGEIEFILDTIADESIVNDDRNFFSYPHTNNIDLKENVKDLLTDNFRKIYMLFGFQDSNLGWQYMRQFIIDGFLSFEIVYDNKGKNIVGFKELDPTSLQPVVEKTGPGKYEQFWIQYPGDTAMSRKLRDEQVLYLSYAKGNSISRVSYIERLVRSYNILRIMENTRVIWNVMNASYRLKFIIPVGTQSPQKAMQTLGQLMSNYKEDVEIDDASGELTVNGRPKIQFYKNYLFPDKNGETPQIESVSQGGPDFNIMDSVVYFFNKLKLDSKIPYARFSFKGGTPSNYQLSIDQMERDEIRFEKFLNRLRSNFQEILVKPLYIQMCLDNPALSSDKSFRSNLGLSFVRENEIEKKIQMSHVMKRTEFIEALAGMVEKVGEEEEPYFDKDFLIGRFLGLSMDDLESNKRYKETIEKMVNSKKDEEDGEEDGKEDGEEGESFTL